MFLRRELRLMAPPVDVSAIRLLLRLRDRRVAFGRSHYAAPEASDAHGLLPWR
jgi:hypothetical protein